MVVVIVTQYSYSNITLHHTLCVLFTSTHWVLIYSGFLCRITINLSSMPTVAFLAAILRLRAQPGIIPLGPKLFATPILILQFLACVVSVMLGIGLNTIIKKDDLYDGGNRGTNGWRIAQQQCNPDTKIIIFGASLQFWTPSTVEEVSNLPNTNRIVILVLLYVPSYSSVVLTLMPRQWHYDIPTIHFLLHLPLPPGNRHSSFVFPNIPPTEGFIPAGVHGVLRPQQCLGHFVDICNRGAD